MLVTGATDIVVAAGLLLTTMGPLTPAAAAAAEMAATGSMTTAGAPSTRGWWAGTGAAVPTEAEAAMGAIGPEATMGPMLVIEAGMATGAAAAMEAAAVAGVETVLVCRVEASAEARSSSSKMASTNARRLSSSHVTTRGKRDSGCTLCMPAGHLHHAVFHALQPDAPLLYRFWNAPGTPLVNM